MLKHDRLKNSLGFTLIELLTVIGILGILALAAIPVFHHFQAEARVIRLINNVNAIKLVMEAAYIEDDQIPIIQNSQSGKVPIELSHLKLTDTFLEFPDLMLWLKNDRDGNDGGTKGQCDPYIKIIVAGDKGLEYLKYFTTVSSSNSFSWTVKPFAIRVPVLAEKNIPCSIVSPVQSVSTGSGTQPHSVQNPQVTAPSTVTSSGPVVSSTQVQNPVTVTQTQPHYDHCLPNPSHGHGHAYGRCKTS